MHYLVGGYLSTGTHRTGSNGEKWQRKKKKKLKQLFSVIYVLDGGDTAHEAYAPALKIPIAFHRERERGERRVWVDNQLSSSKVEQPNRKSYVFSVLMPVHNLAKNKIHSITLGCGGRASRVNCGVKKANNGMFRTVCGVPVHFSHHMLYFFFGLLFWTILFRFVDSVRWFVLVWRQLPHIVTHVSVTIMKMPRECEFENIRQRILRQRQKKWNRP